MTTQAHDPMTVVQAFNEAVNSHDLERIVELFAAHGIVRQVPVAPPPAPAVWTGTQEIRQWFAPQMQNLQVVARNLEVHGDLDTWDATVSGDVFQRLGLDTFTVAAAARVRDGKITSFVITRMPEAVTQWQATVAHGPDQRS